jgi:hypothetical protein
MNAGDRRGFVLFLLFLAVVGLALLWWMIASVAAS